MSYANLQTRQKLNLVSIFFLFLSEFKVKSEFEPICGTGLLSSNGSGEGSFTKPFVLDVKGVYSA